MQSDTRVTRKPEIKLYEDVMKNLLWNCLVGENWPLWHSDTGHFLGLLVFFAWKDIHSYDVLNLYQGFQAMLKYATEYRARNEGMEWNRSPSSIWQHLKAGGMSRFLDSTMSASASGKEV